MRDPKQLTDDELGTELRAIVTAARNGKYDRGWTQQIAQEAASRGWDLYKGEPTMNEPPKPGAALASLNRRVWHTCPQCGKKFEGKTNAVYCGNSCRQAAFQKKKREEK